jgi:hypothetical protein
LALVIGLGSVSALAAAGGARTQTHVYRAFKADGSAAIKVLKTVHGSCFSGSSAINRDDAWRCSSGKFLYDPCFSSSKAKGLVLCPADPWRQSGIEIKLTKPLPAKFRDKGKPSTSGLPWGIETASGLKCRIETGATGVFHHLRANYLCPGNRWLYGGPDRKQEPWTIHQGPAHPSKLHTVAIKIAWF